MLPLRDPRAHHPGTKLSKPDTREVEIIADPKPAAREPHKATPVVYIHNPPSSRGGTLEKDAYGGYHLTCPCGQEQWSDEAIERCSRCKRPPVSGPQDRAMQNRSQ